MPEIDLQQVLREIQESAEKRRNENPEIEAEIQRQRPYFNPAAKREQDPRLAELELYLQQANVEYDTAKLTPGTRFAFVKRVLLRLMGPFSRRQVEFNSVLVRLLNQASKIILEQQNAIQALRQEPEKVVELIRAVSDLHFEEKKTEAVRKLTEVYESSQNPDVRAVGECYRRFSGSESVPTGFDYLLFEDRFRGSESEIKKKQASYLAYFEHHHPVLDVACGRGEFLELLKEKGIPGSGVELDAQMVRRCREKGLEVAEKSLFEYLGETPDESFGGIFAAQLIEHLDHEALVRLIALAFRKLQPGGLLVLETINPASLFVFAHSLYLDPTHRRPYHPQTLDFLCRSLGFTRVSLEFLSPVEENWKIPPLDAPDASRFNAAMERLNNVLYGPQDFAVIAYK